MPTNRKRRVRGLRYTLGLAVERYIRGEIDADELCRVYQNCFARFVLIFPTGVLHREALEIWRRDAQPL